jgi:lambda family phage portal protein
MSARRGWLASRVARMAAGVRYAFGRVAATTFSGASVGRTLSDWVLSPLSADRALRTSYRALKDRARSLLVDNWVAQRYAQLQIDGILGEHGITYRALVLRADVSQMDVDELEDDDAFDEAANAALERAWREWGECATVDGQPWSEVERLAVVGWKCEGEFLALETHGFDGNRFGYALQVLDSDLLDETYNVLKGALPTGGDIVMGVERDRFGRPAAYHLLTAHPSEGRGRERVRVPADRVIHLYTQDRPGQTRGYTRFAPVMVMLRMLGGLFDALLVLLRIAAAKMGFFTKTEFAAQPELPKVAPGGPATDGTQPRAVMDAEPGLATELPYGWDFKAWDTGQPSAETMPFAQRVLQSIASGLGVSYASLTGDLGVANYGSQRVGMVGERDGYKRDAKLLARAVHARVHRGWLTNALLRASFDRSVIDGYDAARFAAAEWQPRGYPWIDPTSDIQAKLAAVAAGVASLTDICAEMGDDIRDVLRKRRREIKLAEKLGVPIVLSLMHADQQTPGAEGAPNPADDAPAPAPKPAAPPRRVPLRSVPGGA